MELSKISQLYEAEVGEEKMEMQTSKALTSAAKKRKVESAQRMEFEMQLKTLNDWFTTTESTLQLLVADNSQEPFTVEEQRVLIQVRWGSNAVRGRGGIRGMCGQENGIGVGGVCRLNWLNSWLRSTILTLASSQTGKNAAFEKD